MDLPTPINDRVAELELAVRELQTELAASRRAGAERVNPVDVWPAITAETEAGTYPDTDEHDLPILFRVASLDVDDALEWTERSEYPETTAASPFGWLPPLWPVEVTWTGKLWRIVSAPDVIHGTLPTDSTAGGYDDGCEEFTMGDGTMRVYRKDASGVYVPQKYSDDSYVLIPVVDTSDEVTAYKFLTAERNVDNDWVIDVEPCEGVCTPS